jgi:hypothetical protein
MVQFRKNVGQEPVVAAQTPSQPVEKARDYETPRIEKREKLAEVTGTNAVGTFVA